MVSVVTDRYDGRRSDKFPSKEGGKQSIRFYKTTI